jgi:hypothetical protein
MRSPLLLRGKSIRLAFKSQEQSTTKGKRVVSLLKVPARD